MSVFFLLIIPVIPIIPYVIYLAASGRVTNPEALGTDKTVLFLSILGVIPAHILTVLVMWFLVVRFYHKPFFKAIGFEWPPSWGPVKGTIICVVTAGVLLGIGLGITYLYGGSKTQLDILIESSTQARLATAFLAFATAPFVEELIYRGFLYTGMERFFNAVFTALGQPALQSTVGVGLTVLIVSSMFAGVHVLQYYNNLAVIAVITLLSFTLTIIRAVTGKLLPCFVIHLVFNGIQSLLLVLSPYLEKPEKVADPAPALESIIHLIHRLF